MTNPRKNSLNSFYSFELNIIADVPLTVFIYGYTWEWSIDLSQTEVIP